MAPKKGQKMSLNEFLEDRTLGSWADEMDALPTAPAPRLDDGGGRGYGGRDDFLSTRPDRAALPPREEVPLPETPPYTAFVGNLAFDLTEGDLGSFFGPAEVVKGAKIIRDRDDKPKGFGYVEFHTVADLKNALAKNGTSFSHRQIRVNVAEPPKERAGAHGAHGDDDKFSGSWRRDGPLPDAGRRDTSNRRRYEGLPTEHRDSAPDTNDNWRANRAPPRFPIDTEAPPVRRRGSGFSTPTHDGEGSPADAEEKWVIGGKFKPSQPEERSGGRFGSVRGRGDVAPPASSVAAEATSWRKSRPPGGSPSPSNSVPPTPQLARRKLELLPRSNSASTQPTPVSSPQATGFSSTSKKPSPFGDARPVDVSAREKLATEKIEREKEEIRERVAKEQQHHQQQQHPMSRQGSRQPRGRPASGRGGDIGARSPSLKPVGALSDEKTPGSPRPSPASVPAPVSTSTSTSTPAPVPIPSVASAKVRESFSFAKAAAAAAGKKEDAAPSEPKQSSSLETDIETESGLDSKTESAGGEASVDANAVADKLAEVSV